MVMWWKTDAIPERRHAITHTISAEKGAIQPAIANLVKVLASVQNKISALFSIKVTNI